MTTLCQYHETNFDVKPYYVPINKQHSPMYDKSKKSWSQRLKITKSEKGTTQMVVPQLPPPQLQPQQLQINEFTGGLEYSHSAISRSMKYAEPWIYGTVRGIPARPMHFHPGQAIFAPMPSEIAVVICSCPEYLNGTKREVKKASICKKCKGSRLPLAPIGGTVRLRPTTAQLQQRLRPTNAATVRVVSSKSRPSILDPQRDPYDLMRRTRLLSPEPKPSSQQQEKNFRSSRGGKSASPNRSRSRTPRSQQDEPKIKASPKPTVQNNKADRWIVEDDSIQHTNDNNHRRSILRCNVNPYDLISNKSNTSSSSSSTQHLNEFSPNHHEDDDDDDVVPDIFGVTTTKQIINQRTAISRKTTGSRSISSPSPSTASSSATTGSSSSTPCSAGSSTSAKTMNYSNVKAIAGQRISFGENTTSSSLITQNGDSFTYENVTPPPTMSLNTDEPKPKAPKQQYTTPTDDTATNTAKLNQPKRPPRRKTDVNPSHNDDATNIVITPAQCNEQQVFLQPSTTDLVAAASQRPSIKSILKKPLSAPASGEHLTANGTAPSKSSLNGVSDSGNTDGTTTDQQSSQLTKHKHQHHYQIKRNSGATHESPIKSSPVATRLVDTMPSKSNEAQKTVPETKTGSQFYIPLPQARKKVQFMVEDKVIQVDSAADYYNGVDNNDDDDDDDEEEYQSAQGDDEDKNEIPKQMGKTLTANCYVATKRGGISKSDTQKLSSNPTSLITDTDDDVGNGDIMDNHIEKSNRFNQKLLHRQLQQQLHQQQEQQEAVLNSLHQESNLVSSKLLNSSKNGYYQNLAHQRPRHDFEEELDEPHYEDVANDNDDGGEDLCRQRYNRTRITDTSLGNLVDVDEKTTIGEAVTTPSVEGASLSTAGLSRNAIRRTHSERHPCNISIGTSSASVILNFKDTMALRVKATRKDSRDIFSNSNTAAQQSVALFRPKEPPPPPPTNGTAAAGSTAVNKQQQHLSNSNRTTVTAKETTSTPAAARGSSKTQTILITTTKDDDNKTNYHYDSVADETIQDNDDDNTNDQRELPSRHRPLSVSNNGLDQHKQRKQLPFIKDGGSQSKGFTAAIANSTNSYQDQTTTRNIYETSDSFSAAIVAETTAPLPLPQTAPSKYTFRNTNQPNRTVVRVAPFNKTSSEIHRLKISHTDDDGKAPGTRNHGSSGATSQKKTSILINGDDCYSTVNVSNDTPLYQSSVVVADGSYIDPMLKVTSNTVTINVVSSSSSRTAEEELIYKNNKINTLLSRGATRAIIPIGSSTNSVNSVSPIDSAKTSPKRGRTLITLDYEKSPSLSNCDSSKDIVVSSPGTDNDDVFSHEEELVKILRNPVEAVRRNLVPHVCGKADSNNSPDQTESTSSKRSRKRHKNNELTVPSTPVGGSERNSFVSKLLEDPTLNHLAEGLDNEVVVNLIENSLKRLKESRNSIDTSGTKDNEDMNRLINLSLRRIKEDRQQLETSNQKALMIPDADDQHDNHSNRGSISSGNSFSSANYEMFDFSDNNESDCYQSCSSEIAADVDTPLATRSKFYQMLVDATLAEIEISTTTEEEDHHYESIRGNGSNTDPIYEEITDIPPPLPLSPPPVNDPELEKKAARSMFEGASKYDILSYLVDAKERGLVREESFEYNINNTSNPIIIEEENDTLGDLKQISDVSSRISHLSATSDSSEDTTTSFIGSMNTDRLSVISALRKGTSSEIERNDSGVGSETSKSSRSKYQNNPQQTGALLSKISPIHLCEDCDGPVETQVTDSGVMFAPLVCRKCGKKRAERKEIITEIVETEEKYGRDLQIILEEFCQPMLVAGLLTQEQLSAIFLNTEELLENNQTLAERMRDGLDIALEQGDDDLLTVNIGNIFLEFTQMLHAFESYCVRQAGASLLLANLEKEKELLRIFLKVSQMENTVLRRMNLNSFLMVPVQRVTKYPLLLARLYKVTPPHLDGRDALKQAKEKIELHLNHINQEAKDVPTKLWRRISSSSPNRRASCEIDMINIKLRKMAIDILEWNHDEVRFAMEGRLLYTQPTDSNWKKGRTIKLNPVNALLVTNGKPSANYKAEKAMSDHLNFPKHTGIREASLLVVKEKCGRYTLIREPLYLDRCIVCTEADWDDYFELQEISSKETFIFKAEDGVRTKQWYTQLQYHAQGMGAWRKRRNALANIMINGMLSRT